MRCHLSPRRTLTGGVALLSLSLLLLQAMSSAQQPATGAAQASSANSEMEWFRATEQTLMDAIASGDKGPWDRVMDASCVVTTEEGELQSKEDFLKATKPLPPGLSGVIRVKDLTVQRFNEFAVVRFRMEEEEKVFAQLLKTQYRTTDTFRRIGDEWKMVASHASVITLDPPAQEVSKLIWPALAGTYKLLPDGWVFHVELRDGALYAGRDPNKLRELIPLAPNAFTMKGALGEWTFVVGNDGRAERIVHFRKFEPLIWTRVHEHE